MIKSFDELLRIQLEKQEIENFQKHRDSDYWYASELGTCMRKQFLRRLGLPPKAKEWRMSFLAEFGKSSHEWIINAIRGTGCLIASEGELKDEKLRYKGRFDAIVDMNPGVIEDPYYSLVDIKTQRPEAFFRRKRSPKAEKVKRFQKMQLASYFYFAKQMPEFQFLQDARLYYLDRGGGIRDEFVFKFSQSMFDEVVKELELLNGYWERKELPPCSNEFVCADLCRPYRIQLRKIERGEMTLNELIQQNAKENKSKVEV